MSRATLEEEFSRNCRAGAGKAQSARLVGGARILLYVAGVLGDNWRGVRGCV